MGRKGAWGGREYGAEASLGRKGAGLGRLQGGKGVCHQGRKGGWGGLGRSVGRMGARGGPTDLRGFQPALAPNINEEDA